MEKMLSPQALQENMITGEKYRFTFMTERLIRLEYSEEGSFEDRPTQTVVNRAFPKVNFRLKRTQDGIEIFTDQVQITYDEKEFTRNGLFALGKGGLHPYGVTWHYGENSKNLKGTTRTLDEVDGRCELDNGILSFIGASVLDDSHTLVLTEDGWVEPRNGKAKDLYLFLYGCDYEEALKDYYTLTGKTPMLPRYALGNWWSRYYKYSEESYCSLIERFEEEKVPFTVAVIDMDWHLVEDVDPKYGSGWTGYTWNKKLFPNPERFLSWLHEHGMQTTLNLHPADGIRAYEDCYEEIAKAMGADTEHEEAVRFDIANKDFLEAYFKYVLHPMEEEGVDFWWIDWQQGNNTKIPGLDPLWMLNHYHFLDSGRDQKRPMTFSRYAGPGSHRYPVGFSGDTIISWESLAFQPYFTATASNIGYGWWSHDIGGHMRGYKNNEMALRWLQLGVFSPINRLHSSNNEFSGKEPWRYPMQIHTIMNDFLRLRHKMMPYLYTMNYLAWKENQPLVRPLYYREPRNPVAYKQENEYYFGSELLAAPITSPLKKEINKGCVNVWLPKGTWIDFFDGTIYRGGRNIQLYRGLESFPVLAKAGGIVPMTEEIFKTDVLHNPASMTIKAFAGADGRFTLYEDDNTTTNYQRDINVRTDMTFDWEKGMFTIEGAKGELTLIPKERCWTVEFVGVKKTDVSVYVGENEITPVSVSYDTDKNLVRITLPAAAVTERVSISLMKAELAENNTKMRLYNLLNESEIAFELKSKVYDIVSEDIPAEVMISHIYSLNLGEDMLGAILEILTA